MEAAGGSRRVGIALSSAPRRYQHRNLAPGKPHLAPGKPRQTVAPDPARIILCKPGLRVITPGRGILITERGKHG